MKSPQYLILISSILFSNCLGSKSILKIDPKLSEIKTTEICTDFQGKHCLDSCDASISSDSLKLVFHEETASTFDDLLIIIVNNKIYTKYKTVYMALDLGSTEWYPVKQLLVLNTDKWYRNAQISGNLKLELQEVYTDTSGNKSFTKTIRFSGQFFSQIH